VECDFGDIVANTLQSGNQLENRRSQDDEMSGRI